MFKLTVTPEVARLRDGAGSRNVRVGGKDGLVLTISNRHPVYVATVPPEVEADAQIVKTEVDEAAMVAAGGRLTVLPTSGDAEVAVEPVAVTGAPPAEAETAELAPVEEPAVQDQIVIDDAKADPDKVNKSNLPKAPKKPRGRAAAKGKAKK